MTLRLVTRNLDMDSAVYQEWCRVGSALSLLMAKTLSNLGHARESRHWWQTAQTAGDVSGKLEARLWVRGERLIRGLYEKRSPHLLIRHADDAIELARDHPCAGLATIRLGRAQAFILAGIPDAAARELSEAEHAINRLPSSVLNDVESVNGMGEDNLRYTETWVYAHMGDTAKADAAAERAIRLYPASDHRSPVQIKLLQAYARTQAGDTTEGIRHAHTTYEALPPAQRTTLITYLAKRVLQPIPPEQQQLPPAADYREMLTLSTLPARKSIES